MADLMQKIMEMIQAEQAKGSNSFNNGIVPYNDGSSNSFNNHATGKQDFKDATINSGQYAGNRNRFNHSEHYDENVLYNSGTFNGNGNGGTIEGGFNAKTRNYYRRR